MHHFDQMIMVNISQKSCWYHGNPDMMSWEHFTSAGIFLQTSNPSLITKKYQTNPVRDNFKNGNRSLWKIPQFKIGKGRLTKRQTLQFLSAHGFFRLLSLLFLRGAIVWTTKILKKKSSKIKHVGNFVYVVEMG